MSVEIKTLGELSINNKGSYGIAASAVPYSPDLYTYLRITDITDSGTLNVDGLMSVADENASDYLLQPYDIVFARTGASTGRNYFYDGTDGEFVYAGFLIKFSIDANKVNPYYVKYFCQSNSYKQWVQSFNTGSTRGNLNAKTYADMPIPVLSRQQQDFLVSVLQPIDDKIALNQQINKNLEEQAQAIYKERFFSATENVLSDICSYSRERVSVETLSFDNYFSTENMLTNKAGWTISANLPTTSHVIKCHIGDVLVSNIRPYFKKILYCHHDCGCSNDVLCFTPKSQKLSAFLYGTLYADRFFDFMVAGAKGTKMPRGDKQQIMTYPIKMPSTEELEAYNSLAVPMLQIIYNNTSEIIRLAAIRDALLPRLMSGEIDVSSVEA